MRLVGTHSLSSGMIIAETIFDKEGNIFLYEGTELNDKSIERIKSLGLSGLFINERFDINYEKVISDTLKQRAVQSIKNTYILVNDESNNSSFNEQSELLNDLVNRILDSITSDNKCMFNMVDIRFFDEYTYYHSVNVTVLSLVLGMGLDLDEEELLDLGFSALLHDVGKVFINKEILNKPEKLTEEEMEKMKDHSYLGYDYLIKQNFINERIAEGVLHHHERENGSGYPYNLQGDDISLFGKIIAVADVYDALVSERPYKKGMLPSEAVEYIYAGIGTLFNGEVVEILKKKVAVYPQGTKVRLSNNSIGYVVENHEDFGLRPTIKIVEENGTSIEPYIINLKDDKSKLNITIIEQLD